MKFMNQKWGRGTFLVMLLEERNTLLKGIQVRLQLTISTPKEKGMTYGVHQVQRAESMTKESTSKLANQRGKDPNTPDPEPIVKLKARNPLGGKNH